MKLSLLCVSAGADYAQPFVEELDLIAERLDVEFVLFDGRGAGAIEYVLEEALELCSGEYVLRVDDDERVSQPMLEWLELELYRSADHWSFPRRHLYPDESHFVTTAPLWPDLQTRLSVRAKAGGRASVHAGSPFGAGSTAPVPLDHYKFLVRSLEERRELVQRYEELQAGAGRRFAVFSVPESFELETAVLAYSGAGAC